MDVPAFCREHRQAPAIGRPDWRPEPGPLLSALGQVARLATRSVDQPNVAAIAPGQMLVLVKLCRRARPLHDISEPPPIRGQRRLAELLELHQVTDRQTCPPARSSRPR